MALAEEGDLRLHQSSPRESREPHLHRAGPGLQGPQGVRGGVSPSNNQFDGDSFIYSVVLLRTVRTKRSSRLVKTFCL